jgi:hypothetical protein
LNQVKPAQNSSTQIALSTVVISSELATKAVGAEQRNLGFSFQFEATPNQPEIKIETTWRVGERAYNVQIRWDRMIADFIPELFAQNDHVVARQRLVGNAIFHIPESHVIEESKPGEFPNRTLRKTVISAKVNRAREDAFKPVDEPAVVLPVSRQTEFFEHFGA